MVSFFTRLFCDHDILYMSKTVIHGYGWDPAATHPSNLYTVVSYKCKKCNKVGTVKFDKIQNIDLDVLNGITSPKPTSE